MSPRPRCACFLGKSSSGSWIASAVQVRRAAWCHQLLYLGHARGHPLCCGGSHGLWSRVGLVAHRENAKLRRRTLSNSPTIMYVCACTLLKPRKPARKPTNTSTNTSRFPGAYLFIYCFLFQRSGKNKRGNRYFALAARSDDRRQPRGTFVYVCVRLRTLCTGRSPNHTDFLLRLSRVTAETSSTATMGKKKKKGYENLACIIPRCSDACADARADALADA